MILKETMLLLTDQVMKVKEVEYKVHEINDSQTSGQGK